MNECRFTRLLGTTEQLGCGSRFPCSLSSVNKFMGFMWPGTFNTRSFYAYKSRLLDSAITCHAYSVSGWPSHFFGVLASWSAIHFWVWLAAFDFRAVQSTERVQLLSLLACPRWCRVVFMWLMLLMQTWRGFSHAKPLSLSSYIVVRYEHIS